VPGSDSPGWLTQEGHPSNQPRLPQPDLRASDAERHQIAQLLGEHYADGRLDESELEDRLAEAMSAKTRWQLSSLVADLPRLADRQPVVPPPRRWRTGLLVVAAGLVLVASRLWWSGWHYAAGVRNMHVVPSAPGLPVRYHVLPGPHVVAGAGVALAMPLLILVGLLVVLAVAVSRRLRRRSDSGR
jgi:Domain of unknown function (DUF1707)